MLFGDLLQLQPVQAAYPFVEISSEKIQKRCPVFSKFMATIRLNINQRQKTSAAHGEEWKELS